MIFVGCVSGRSRTVNVGILKRNHEGRRRGCSELVLLRDPRAEHPPPRALRRRRRPARRGGAPADATLGAARADRGARRALGGRRAHRAHGARARLGVGASRVAARPGAALRRGVPRAVAAHEPHVPRAVPRLHGDDLPENGECRRGRPIRWVARVPDLRRGRRTGRYPLPRGHVAQQQPPQQRADTLFL